uniref:cold shock domain-containing protein E1-like n=1 Tax=Ciona intestinalis TaxID=7719 RepID=UPI000180B6F2|nr:cold shock domain-containing protein E1-like [Ciona intestinalis]|eukprot:XP_002127595.1 cold shock domain-containing protein E1-like [Ciona intestinalis]
MHRSIMWPTTNGTPQNSLSFSNSLSSLLGAQPFRPQTPVLSNQQKVLVNGGISALQQHQQEAKERQMVNRRSLNRTASCGLFPQNGIVRPSALNQHRALQRSTSFDSPRMMSTPGSVTPISGSTSPIPLVAATAAGVTNSNGYRSRETGVIEKLLVSYGFIKCADREGRLFFHYSQFHGEAHTLHINDEIEFEVSMDTRTGKPVAVQVVKLQKGTVAFEVLSEDRILGEVTNPAPPLSLIPGQNLMNVVPGGTTGIAGHGYRPSEKGDPVISGKLGSLSYERMGEFFFLHYSASDLTNPDLALLPGDKVSFNIATEKRTGVMRARKITLVERAPPKRFNGIVTAMKESFGFIERSDIVKEIFFHYSEVLANVPDLHVGDHVEFSVQERNNKDVATEIRLLPLGTVQLEEISSELFVGTIDKPLPAKAPNKVMSESTIAGGDATSPNQTLKSGAIVNGGSSPPQPSLVLAGIISYIAPTGETFKIRFGEKDRAANCLHTLCKGDKVSFLTITDKRNGQQRAAGVTLLLDKTIAASKEKREQGIVAAVKEGFGFIKCVERDSRLFFHCCEMLDPTHHVRMSDEVQFTVLLDPVAEKQRMHATRIRVLPKGTVIFHIISDQSFTGIVEALPGASPNTAPKSPTDCLFSPALGPNPGIIVYSVGVQADPSADTVARIPFASKDFKDWMEALSLKVGDTVEFKICEVKRTAAKSAVDIKLLTRHSDYDVNNAASRRRTLSHSMSAASLKLETLPEEASFPTIVLENVPVKSKSTTPEVTMSPKKPSSEVNIAKEDKDESEIVEKLSEASFSPRSDNIETSCGEQCYGWISTLKDTFGFIESLNHGSEIFFHYSEMQAPVDKYKAGCPVTYVTGIKEEKACALQVEVITDEEMPTSDVVSSKIIKGKVLKPLKSVNPSQTSYQGLIEYKETNEADETTIKTISYSPLSLSDRRDFIQVGDKVTFQVSTDINSNCQRAANVNVNRETVKATVDSIKGEFGFINYEVKGGDTTGGSGKLFFHMSEVRDATQQITAGSTVEFSVIYNQRSGKFSASKVRLAEAQPKQQRPERLRLRSTCETTGPTVSVLRQPRGPTENTTGFAVVRHTEADDSQETENA